MVTSIDKPIPPSVSPEIVETVREELSLLVPLTLCAASLVPISGLQVVFSPILTSAAWVLFTSVSLRPSIRCVIPYARLPQSLKEQFSRQETAQLLTLLDKAGHISRVSRGRVFEDFLTLSICALSGGAMEDEYLGTIKAYTDGKPGKRGVDLQAALFGELVRVMEETRDDILGDLFQGAITFGENGQFLTPDSICELMAQLSGAEGKTVCDPCCGSGRMLLAAARLNRDREFIGQDVDLRCVRMTAINLALRGLYGYVIWGDSLKQEQRLIYRTGFNGRGFVRIANHLPPAGADPEASASITETGDQAPVETVAPPLVSEPEQNIPAVQRRLF